MEVTITLPSSQLIADSPERAAPKKDGAKKDATPPDVQALIAQAEQAIQKGADAAKVKARLNEMLKAKGYSIK